VLNLDLQVNLPKIDTGPFGFGQTLVQEDPRLAEHRSGLLPFTLHTFPTYQDAWFHRTICDHLDKWISGEITRLMVFMPPRYGKSELVSRRLPAYILGKDPTAHIISASYGADLSRLMNLDVQRIIDSDEYRELFPRTLLSSSNVRNNKKGGSWLRNSDMFEVVEYAGMYRGAGVGGAITGMGMNYGIIDDPVKNRKDATSPTVSNAVWQWYTSTFRTRLMGKGSILLTVTRWDENDLAGRLLRLAEENPKADQWTVLRFPAICDGSGGELDKREEGEVLWPERYDLDSLEATRASVTDQDWSSLYQQSPTVVGGSIYKQEFWAENRNRYSIHDRRQENTVIGRWFFIDTAMKSKDDSDYSVIAVVEMLPDYRIRLRHVWREKIDSAFLPQIIIDLAQRWNHDEKLQNIVIEDKSSGTTVIQTLRLVAPEWIASIIQEFQPAGTKEYRAKQGSVWCNFDMVLLPYVDELLDWYNDCISDENGELFKFPNAQNDDFVDTFSMAILFLEHYLQQGNLARTARIATN